MPADSRTDAPPDRDEFAALNAYWRAANYLGVAQIYLRANCLSEEPLRPDRIKPRLLGHWGTAPGIILYAAKNEALSKVWNFRVISEVSASLWSVRTRVRQSSMAPLNVAKSG